MHRKAMWSLLMVAVLVGSCGIWGALTGTAENAERTTAHTERTASAIADTAELVSEWLAVIVPLLGIAVTAWIRQWIRSHKLGREVNAKDADITKLRERAERAEGELHVLKNGGGDG